VYQLPLHLSHQEWLTKIQTKTPLAVFSPLSSLLSLTEETKFSRPCDSPIKIMSKNCSTTDLWLFNRLDSARGVSDQYDSARGVSDLYELPYLVF